MLTDPASLCFSFHTVTCYHVPIVVRVDDFLGCVHHGHTCFDDELGNHYLYTDGASPCDSSLFSLLQLHTPMETYHKIGNTQDDNEL